jgi:transcriptional regulator with XRE-family HTH domain
LLLSERSAQIIRTAREQSGLTQRELAGKLHVDIARIADYETAKVDPTVEMLSSIVAAAGLDLEIALRPRTDPVLRRRAQLRRLAARAVDRSMLIEGKQVIGQRLDTPLDEGDLLRRIVAHDQ